MLSIALRIPIGILLSEAINRLWGENLDEVARLVPQGRARKEASRFERKVKNGQSEGST